MVVTLPRAQESTVQAVIFGKLPHRSDFLRINATHPVAHELDELIQGALEQCRLQDRWEERYDACPMLDLCYTSRDRKWLLVGTLRTSRDQSGRRYPLVAGVAFPTQSMAGERRLIPIACEVYFEGLREQLTHTVSGPGEGHDCREFLESQASLWATGSSSDMPLAAEIIHHFLDTQHPSILEAPLQEDTPAGTITQAILNLIFFRDFLRRFSSMGAAQTIELPLRNGKGIAPLHASAWLALLAAIHGPESPWQGSFLLRHGPGEASARLFATFGQMPDRALIAALGGIPPEDGRMDLSTEQKVWRAHRIYPETAYALERTVANPILVISGLISFITNTCKKITTINPQ